MPTFVILHAGKGIIALVTEVLGVETVTISANMKNREKRFFGEAIRLITGTYNTMNISQLSSKNEQITSNQNDLLASISGIAQIVKKIQKHLVQLDAEIEKLARQTTM